MLARILWQLLQLVGATGRSERISDSVNGDRTWSMASAGHLGAGHDSETPQEEHTTEATALVAVPQQPRTSKLALVLAIGGAGLAGIPTIFTMADLVTDALPMLLRNEKFPEFRKVWEKIVAEKDWKLGTAISIVFIAAYAGMGLFNIFNTQLTIKDLLTRRTSDVVDERDKILRAADAFDTSLGAVLKFVFGLPVGAMLDKAWQEELLIATPVADLWGTIGAGIPIQKVVQMFMVEIPRTVYSAISFFCPLQRLAGPDSPRAMRLELLGNTLNAVNILQLTPQVFLRHIDPTTDITEILAQLLVHGESRPIEMGIKKFLTEIVLFPAGIAIAWPATPFFEILGKASVLAMMKPLGIDVDSEAAQKTAEVMGKVSRLGFFMMWSLLLKDTLIRPLMRLVSQGKWTHAEAADSFIKRISNCNTWCEAALNILSMMCGAAIGVTNLPLIAPGPDHNATAINAFTANTAVSVNGLMGFLKMTGTFGMRADVYDTVGARLMKFYGELATMSQDQTRELVTTIRERVTAIKAEQSARVEELPSETPASTPGYQTLPA